MTRRSLLAFVVITASLSLAASTGTAVPPPESQVHPAWLTGTWSATGWQVAGDTAQAQRDTLVTFAPDGTWKTPAGGSGTSWLVGDDVFVKGSTADGYQFQYSLKNRQNANGSRELYGVVAARPAPARCS
jgi:hypothetical protein